MVCLGCLPAPASPSRCARHQSLPRGQKNAGLAMGFTLPQVYRHVLLPMAFRMVVPPLTSEFLNIFKNSAVCSTIGLLELAARAATGRLHGPALRVLHCRHRCSTC
jgi:glutamate/aspartate transport system permease protein